MDGFDTSTMTYFSTPLDMMADGTSNPWPPDAKALLSMGIEPRTDTHSTYDAHTFAGSDDFYGLQQQQQQQQQVTPTLSRFNTAVQFDEQFSDVVSAFDNPINQEPQEGETPQIDRDHKLLAFSPPTFDYRLLDYNYRQISINMSAQLHGMFFLAESPWASNCDSATSPAELTCYRRNLFQITGNIALPRALRFVLSDQGNQIPIMSQELSVSATESTEGNAVKVISVPWKTPANVNPAAPDDKTEREPPSIPLDLSSMQDMDSEYSNLPFQWKRLQFRIATANNGRRKELQQHFTLHLKVMATLATGGKVAICHARSGAIIVRGRSPRNFQSRKDMPLSGAGNHVRKSANTATLHRTTSGERKASIHEPTSAPTKPEATAGAAGPAMSVASYYEQNDFQMPGLFDGLLQEPVHNLSGHGPGSSAGGGALTALPAEPMTFNLPGYAATSPDLARHQQAPSTPLAPILPLAAPQKLSLVEDETPKQTSTSPPRNSLTPSHQHQREHQQQQQHHPSKRMAPPRLPSQLSLNVVSSPDESADLLYEYFPLSLDDWMPPVDAVYRPHVVHHTNMPSDPRKGPKAMTRSKRYFSEDVG